MKKNISINISGIIFHIEEDGYETLRKYLDSVNRYFSSFEDSSEILADIESRIAEIFLAKLNEGKQVITAEDINSLITTMGNVNDFKAAEDTEFASAASEPQPKQKQRFAGDASPNKRLYRDRKRKILGGVCAGLAHYFNVDSVWPRLILALLALGYGGGIVLYIILWIALPASDSLEEEASIKKMFRNPDEKVLGGVAGGIASFFGTDVVLIRLLFVVTAFFGGVGFILYIILWISLPEAKTITEKMEMQGEPVTLSNIESTVKKGLNEKDQPEESTLAKIILFPFRTLAAVLNALVKFLGPVFRVSIDVLRVAIGIIITVLGITMVISLLLMAGVALGVFSPSSMIWGDMQLRGISLPIQAMRNAFPGWTVVFTFLAAFIPALFIMLIGSSIIAKKVVFKPIVGWSMFVLFFVSIAVVSISVPQLIYAFKEEGEFKEEKTFTATGKKLSLLINEVGLDDYDVTELTLRGHDAKEIRLVQRFESQGSTRKIASENAQMVTYQVAQKNDSTFVFDSNIVFKPDAKFRAQRLKMDLFIPYQQQFTIDKELWRLIDNYNRYGYRYNGYRYSDYNTSEDQVWELTEDGLICVTCKQEAADESDDFGDTRFDDGDEPTDFDSSVNGGLGDQDQYGLQNFTSVDISGMIDAKIIKGSFFSVRLEGDETQKSRYNISQDGETLVIEYEDQRKFFWKDNPFNEDRVKVTVTMPHLTEASLRGAGKIKINGFEEDELDLNVSGAMEIDAWLKAANLNIDINGASFVDLEGEGNFMDVNLSGASGLRAFNYEVERAVVEAHGASNAKVNVTERLETSSGVASNISHRGNPEIVKR